MKLFDVPQDFNPRGLDSLLQHFPGAPKEEKCRGERAAKFARHGGIKPREIYRRRCAENPEGVDEETLPFRTFLIGRDRSQKFFPELTYVGVSGELGDERGAERSVI